MNEYKKLEEKIKDLMYSITNDMKHLDCKSLEDAEKIIDYYENTSAELFVMVDNAYLHAMHKEQDYKDNHRNDEDFNEKYEQYVEPCKQLRKAQDALSGLSVMFGLYYKSYLSKKEVESHI